MSTSNSFGSAPTGSAPSNPALPKAAAAFFLLWVEWIGLLGAAMILGNVLDGHGKMLPTVARMGASVVLVLAAWWGWKVWQGGRGSLCTGDRRGHDAGRDRRFL